MRIVVTGAWGYTGRPITERLLAAGHHVITLTRSPQARSPFGDRVVAYPLDFDHPVVLQDALRGADVFVNTYWIRYARGGVTHDTAVRNSRLMVDAAKQAGVKRIVHVSISSANPQSPLPYFRGKGQVEEHIRASGLSHAILRPTVLFGRGDVLLNNIAWLARRFPVFPIFGDGRYRLQPVHVEDMADQVARQVDGADSLTRDVAGPETYTFEEMVLLIARTVGANPRIVHVSPALGPLITEPFSLALGDVLLTQDEITGLMAETLISQEEPLGTVRLSEWLRANAPTLGARYASESRRHYYGRG